MCSSDAHGITGALHDGQIFTRVPLLQSCCCLEHFRCKPSTIIEQSLPGLHAGLPFRGAPLLLPVELVMRLVSRRSSLQLHISAPFILLQLPLAALPSLQSLGQAFPSAEVCCCRGHGFSTFRPNCGMAATNFPM